MADKSELLAVWICDPATIILCVLRLVSRIWKRPTRAHCRCFTTGDLWVCIAVILVGARLIAKLCFTNRFGTPLDRSWSGKSIDRLTDQHEHMLVVSGKLAVFIRAAFVCILWSFKLAVVDFLLNFLREYRRERLVLWTLRIILGLTFVAAFVTVFVECRPLSLYWTLRPGEKKCSDVILWITAYESANILTNVLLILLPIPAILRGRAFAALCHRHHHQINTQEGAGSINAPPAPSSPGKVARMASVFGLGLFLVAVNVMRLCIGLGFSGVQSSRQSPTIEDDDEDGGGGPGDTIVWAAVETATAACVANLPALYLMLRGTVIDISGGGIPTSAGAEEGYEQGRGAGSALGAPVDGQNPSIIHNRSPLASKSRPHYQLHRRNADFNPHSDSGVGLFKAPTHSSLSKGRAATSSRVSHNTVSSATVPSRPGIASVGATRLSPVPAAVCSSGKPNGGSTNTDVSPACVPGPSSVTTTAATTPSSTNIPGLQPMTRTVTTSPPPWAPWDDRPSSARLADPYHPSSSSFAVALGERKYRGKVEGSDGVGVTTRVYAVDTIQAGSGGGDSEWPGDGGKAGATPKKSLAQSLGWAPDWRSRERRRRSATGDDGSSSIHHIIRRGVRDDSNGISERGGILVTTETTQEISEIGDAGLTPIISGTAATGVGDS